MSVFLDHLDRFVDKIEIAFGWDSDEHKRACAVHRYWRERGKPDAPIKPANLITELVGYEIEIKRLRGEPIGVGSKSSSGAASSRH